MLVVLATNSKQSTDNHQQWDWRNSKTQKIKMRYIVLKTEVNSDGSITISGIHKSTHDSSGVSAEWIDVKIAKTNTIDPSICDFMSFDDKESATDFLLEANLDSDHIIVVGVEVD